MAAPARDLIVNLVGKTNQLMGPLQGASAQMSQIGSTLTRTLTPAAAGLAAGMGLAAKEFNSGVDALRVGTGATGDRLKEMTAQMKNVAGDASLARIGLGRVGEIMADVNTRTGATGDTLEALTTQFGQLERMGQAADVGNVARVFGDWTIATEDQTAVMDKLFLASQSSGASIDDLSTKVVQFGAPLRNLGFGFEEATALIASFEKNGVNLETVMGGLRQGIGKLAKEGEDVPDTFKRIVKEIENTEDSSEATRLAIELFGQRAGPDLADAIQNGQFAVDDMLAALESGSDSINQAAEDTTRLSDKLLAFKNRVVGAIGPVGEIGAVVGGFAASIGPALMGLGQMVPILGTVGTAFKALTLVMMTNPFVLIATAVVALGALLFFHRDKVLAALTAAWEFVRDTAKDVWEAIKGFFSDALDFIVDLVLNWTLAGRIIKHWDDIKNAAVAVKDWVVGRFRDLLNIVADLFLNWTLAGRIIQHWDEIKDAALGVYNWVKEKFLLLWAFFTGFPGMVRDAFSTLADMIKAPFVSAFNAIKSLWNSTVGGFGFTVPKWVPGLSGKSFRIPEMHTGGIFDSGRGEGLALLRDGEEILTRNDPRHRMNNRRQAVTVVVPLTLDGRVVAEAVAEANLAAGGQF